MRVTKADINKDGYPETPEINMNLNTLVERLNKLIDKGCPIKRITSGLRSQADQQRINPSAPKSKHLVGAAADVEDREHFVKLWCTNNVNILEDVGLWCEALSSTPTWTHFQIFPPKSGKRFFQP